MHAVNAGSLRLASFDPARTQRGGNDCTAARGLAQTKVEMVVNGGRKVSPGAGIQGLPNEQSREWRRGKARSQPAGMRFYLPSGTGARTRSPAARTGGDDLRDARVACTCSIHPLRIVRGGMDDSVCLRRVTGAARSCIRARSRPAFPFEVWRVACGHLPKANHARSNMSPGACAYALPATLPPSPSRDRELQAEENGNSADGGPGIGGSGGVRGETLWVSSRIKLAFGVHLWNARGCCRGP